APNPKCPADDTELKKDQVFPDVFTKRELNNLRLHCPNTGCSWICTNEEMQKHDAECAFRLISCIHTQCKDKFLRSHLGEHLKSECKYRNVKCQYCRKDVPFASIQAHVGTVCEGAPVYCRYCKAEILRKDIEQHEQLICDEVPGTCEFNVVGCHHDG
ncbi:TNF receptor-associated factor 6, partial [Paramuricea clavata]